jgi:hypothetical protein
MKKKLYVIEKFVWANSINDALKREKQLAPSNCYLDPKWRENHTTYEK